MSDLGFTEYRVTLSDANLQITWVCWTNKICEAKKIAAGRNAKLEGFFEGNWYFIDWKKV